MKPAAFIVSAAALIGLAVSSANSAPIGRTGLSVPYSQFGARGACDKQKRVLISRNGGLFTIPACSGFNATIKYPPTLNRKGDRLLITSSVSSNFGVPPPASGTAVFYVQMTNNSPHHGQPVFEDTGVTNTITGSELLPNHTYTLIVYNFLLDDQCSNTPCPPWTLNIGSPNPSTHSITFSSPLNGAAWNGGILNVVWQFVQN